MPDLDEVAFHMAMSLLEPLTKTYAATLGPNEQYLGLLLPDGTVTKSYGIFILTPTVLRKLEESNQNPELMLHLVHESVEEQVAKNKFTLGINVVRGESTHEYYLLDDCQLLTNEQ